MLPLVEFLQISVLIGVPCVHQTLVLRSRILSNDDTAAVLIYIPVRLDSFNSTPKADNLTS